MRLLGRRRGRANTGDSELDAKIEEWFSLNKDPETERQGSRLLGQKSVDELKALFMKRMTFGTAGLRGRMGPGYSQMNELVVIQTAQGLLRYLKSLNLQDKPLVVGYDGRKRSRRFAELTANIFIRDGIRVYLPHSVVPTPFVPFGVLKYQAAAGVMVTASHNPKEDNGYKVYWSNGSQIISPHDKNITKFIEEDLAPKEEYWNVSAVYETPGLLIDPLSELETCYCKILKENKYIPTESQPIVPRLTYTAMHGVGYNFIVKAFEAVEFPEVIPVKEQISPDCDFPTVEFPNPEEGKSALKLSFQTAEENDSPIILANDPDADRLGVAERIPGCHWKIFNGNEIGALLAFWMIHTYKRKNPEKTDFSDVYVLSSTVSSKIVKTIAAKEGFTFEETLTGFKWMGNRTRELVKAQKTVLFAFEEAIGFMCDGTNIPDKDGVSAAVRVAELATYLYNKNQTLTSKLEELYQQYGYHISNNSYYYCHDPDKIKSMFKDLSNFNGKENTYPKAILEGKYEISNIRDLTRGYDDNYEDKKARLPVSESSPMITFTFKNGLIATLRASGTEPKVKYYTELCVTPDMKDMSVIKSTLSEMVSAIIEEFMQPEKYGFKPKKD